MQEAWSRLKSVLDRDGLTTADLVRRVSEQGDRINAKSLYRLADPQEPLEKVDMRVIGAVCQALAVEIGDILTFEEPTIIEEFDPSLQARMDTLVARQKSSPQAFSATDLAELDRLVDQAEAIARGNARRLANQRRRLHRDQNRRQQKTKQNEAGD